MYIPKFFRESDLCQLEGFITQYPFGSLITVEDGSPYVTQLPFLASKDDSGQSILSAHMAKANPQWRHFESNQTVLAMFQGPHTYISPGWYNAPGVPTWNYTTVQVRGTVRMIDSDDEALDLLTRMTRQFEDGSSDPWVPEFTEQSHFDRLKAIVGFEISVETIQGKFKLNQNRSEEDRQLVIERLKENGSSQGRAVAELMESRQIPD